MGLPVTKFSDAVRVMNQSNSQKLTMTSDDARALLSEIVDLLNRVSDLSALKLVVPESFDSNVEVDGGKF